MDPIYLDYNATTPIEPAVLDAMLPFFQEHFGNPSSTHLYGVAPKRALERARRQVADLLGADAEEVLFTSGGTESNNYAIVGRLRAARREGRDHLILSAIEHPATVEVARWLEGQNCRITVLPVDVTGRVDPADLERAIDERTALVSIMHANNEVGTIQPIAALAEIAHAHGALMHTDAAQSLGKAPVDVAALGVDLLSVAGHKLYAPKGVGALYVRDGVTLERILHGAGQEGGRRAGTENVALSVGLGTACEIASRDLEANIAHFAATRDRLYHGLRAQFGEDRMRVNGHPTERLANTLSVSFKGVAANELLEEIGLDVAASAGAACHSDRVEMSAVLAAMGVEEVWGMGTLRLTTGRGTTSEDVERAAQVIGDAARDLS